MSKRNGKRRSARIKEELVLRDPFDRLLAAQALSEDLTPISRDAVFDLYGVKRLW